MRKFMNAVKGAALVEYGILVGLIAVLAIGAVMALGGQIQETFQKVSSELSTSLNSTLDNNSQ